MAYELTKKDMELLDVIHETSLSDLLKPLSKEIHLFDTHISGMNSIKDQSAFKDLQMDSVLTLKREISKFDDNEIVVYFQNAKIGTIPEKDNTIFARLMDAGKLLKGKVKRIEWERSFIHVYIGIYLVDY